MSRYNFNARRLQGGDGYYRCDIGLLISVILLWGTGLFTMLVCSQNYAARFFNNDALYFVKRQIICSGVGFVFFHRSSRTKASSPQISYARAG